MNRRDDYRAFHPGAHRGEVADTDRRTFSHPHVLLVDVAYNVSGVPGSSAVVLEANKPDPRLTLTLGIGFAPREPDDGEGIDTFIAPGVTVGVVLGGATAWLAKCENFGGGLRECEDFFGTRGAPATFVGGGLWGASWEIDEDCTGVRGRLVLPAAGIAGRWTAFARWVAVQPMSEADWSAAKALFYLTRSTDTPTVYNPGRKPPE